MERPGSGVCIACWYSTEKAEATLETNQRSNAILGSFLHLNWGKNNPRNEVPDS
ncbi:hypothetical protein K443DRAFT_680567, partial [Laccaria amethystina LaAM-08-1]